jgi:hypothetical protein
VKNSIKVYRIRKKREWIKIKNVKKNEIKTGKDMKWKEGFKGDLGPPMNNLSISLEMER